ncbi:hypothetical protein ACH4SP_11185 [Streptomyces sp. NPDC021093]|uniref:hypothetical protein n=1 Tax=Streptomyces sp. NPDC021093 TaxID=3365112 RepID=UPI0037B54A44
MKRTIGIAVTAFGLAAGSLLIATPAQASAACDSAYRAATSGHVYAYNLPNCSGLLGHTAGDDADWGDGAGPFTGSDTNNAESVLNKGIEDGYSTVRFSNYTAYDTANGYGCLKRGELYADTLWDNKMSNGSPAANSISSHKWVATSYGCASIFR